MSLPRWLARVWPVRIWLAAFPANAPGGLTALLPSIRNSVRNRLAAVFLLVILGAISLAGLVNMYIHLRGMQRELESHTLEALQEGQNALLRLSRQAGNTARLLAGLAEVRRGLVEGGLPERLEELRDQWPLGLVEVFDRSGVAVARVDSGDARAEGFATPAGSPNLMRALKLETGTDYVLTPTGLCVRAFAPVLAPGGLAVAGAVAVSYPVGSPQLAALKDQLHADFLLRVDAAEKGGAGLLVGTFTDAAGEPLTQGFRVPAAGTLSHPVSLGLGHGPGGDYSLAVAPLLDNQEQPVATLAALQHDGSIRAGIMQTARFMLAAAGLAALLALGLGWLVANSFTRPIRQLHEAMAAVAQGRLDSRVDLRQKDELGQLGAGFNTMVSRLEAARNALANALEIKASYGREMEAANRKLASFNQELEGQVEERTREITLRNLARRREVEERHHAERQLRESEQRLMDILEFLPDATFVIDSEGVIIAWNRAIEDLTGVPAAQVLGRGGHEYSLAFYGERRPTLIDLVLDTDPEREQLYPDVTRVGDTLRTEIALPNLRGRMAYLSAIATPLFNSEGAVIGAIEGIRDVTDRVKAQKKLSHHALHDTLTGLANRSLFADRLEHALRRSHRNPDFRLAVLLLDLDRFKRVNDTLGHLAGDMLLTTVARRLEAVVRDVDTVARLGGDEFVVLLDGILAPRDAIHIAGRILEDVGHPVTVGGHEIFTSASVGIVFSNGEYDRTEDILRDADIAMYRAKDLGRSRYKVFHSGLRKKAMHQMTLEGELRRAVDLGQFELLYQPLWDMRRMRLTGFEALLRWRHEERGLLKPSHFLSTLEESGLIFPVGEWVLNRACRDAALWRNGHGRQGTAAGHGSGPVLHVNLSGRQFGQSDLTERVFQAVQAAGLKPDALLVEITEGELMHDPRATARRLSQLRETGVKVGLDDFGTGYSSLSSLQQYPLDMLKVDKSFVARMQISDENLRIVQAIVALAGGLGLEVAAEGVEHDAQRLRLLSLGCIQGQGNLFAQPLELTAALALAEAARNRPGGLQG